MNKEILPNRHAKIPNAAFFLSGQTTAADKRFGLEDTSISAFKYVIFDTSLQSVMALVSRKDHLMWIKSNWKACYLSVGKNNRQGLRKVRI